MSMSVDEKTVRERIEAREYDTKIPYEFVATPANDDMTVRQALEHEAEQKRLRSEHSARRRADDRRLEEKFRADLAAQHRITGHPKEERVWEMAWERGHSYGWLEIASEYEDLAELAR